MPKDIASHIKIYSTQIYELIKIKQDGNNQIKLGVEVADKVTGFNGIVTGKAEYLTGCNQYLVQPKTKPSKGNYEEGIWLDEGRLEVKGEGINKKEVKAEENGGPEGSALKK